MILLPLPDGDGSRPAAGGLEREGDTASGAGADPWGTPLPHGMALAFGPNGLSLVRVSLIDTASMDCTASWWITEDGGVRDADHDHDLGFAGPMATIVHLNTPDGHETVTRRLSPHQWGFGWHVDERRAVVVAEAQYREAREAPSDIDMALVRTLCDACINPARPGPEANGAAAPRTAAGRRSSPLAMLAAVPTAVQEAPLAAVEASAPVAPPRDRLPGGWRRWLAGLCVLALLALGLGVAQWRRSQTLASESQRLRTLSEATLVQTVGAALEHGDYGELQSDLDRFEGLRYFDAAVVANARGQVVSTSGAARGVRIGEVLTPEAVAGSRVVALRDGAGQQIGRLHIWQRTGAP